MFDTPYIPGLTRDMKSKDAALGLLIIPAGLVFIAAFVAALFAFCVLPA
jgi:hypothetical protein